MASKIIINRPRRSYSTQTVALSPRGGTTTPAQTFTFGWTCDKVSSGTENPKYRELIAAGSDASTAYSVTYKTVKASDVLHYATGNYKSSPYKEDFKCLHLGFPIRTKPEFAGLPVATSVRGDAVTRFYSRVADTMHQFKGMAFLGELQKTVDTIGDLISAGLTLIRELWSYLSQFRRRLRSLLRRLRDRRQRRRAYARALRSVSERYLQFVFGIQPIIQDIEDLYSVYCQEYVEVKHLRSSARGRNVSTISNTMAFCNSMCWGRTETTTTTSVKTVCRGAISIAKPAQPNTLMGQADRLGISLREVVPTLWELTPFSFLVDYFIDVSGLINTVVYADQRFVYAVASTKQESTVVVSLSPGGKADDTHWTYKVVDWNVSPATVELWSLAFSRENIKPSMGSIRFSVPTSAKRIANMIALFLQWVSHSHITRE